VGARVLLLNQYFPPDTAVTGHHARSIGARLAADGFEVAAVVGQPSYGEDLPRAPARERRDGMDVIRVQTGRRRGRRRLTRRIGGYARYLAGAWRASRTVRPDLVLAFHNPPLLGLLAAHVAGRRGAKLVLVVEDIHPDIVEATGWVDLPRFLIRAWDRLNRRSLRAAARVVVLGEDMRRTLVEKKRLDPGAVTVIPLWSEPELTPAARDEEWRRDHGVNGELLVLCAGNLGVMQPFEPVIQAMSALRDAPVSLTVVGDGIRRPEWERRAAELGLENVRFLGWLADEDYRRAVSAADAALVSLAPGMERLSVPSRSFTFLSAGRPVIALMAPESDVASFVARHGCGWVAPSADELTELLLRLSGDPSVCRRAGDQARAAYERNFESRVLTRRYSELVAEVSSSSAQ
jgi:glycosyltransferase involved in cell wall biosynthesis